MKRLILFFIILMLVSGFVFASTYYHHHNWSSWYDSTSKTGTRYGSDGKYLRSNAAGNGVTYTFRAYGLAASESSKAWNAYVNGGYALKYIGGKYYFSSSDSWSEPTYLNDYLYPSYINYLRPGQ